MTETQYREDPLTEDQWQSMDRSFLASPMANILQASNVKLHPRKLANLPERAWRRMKKQAYGITEPVLTILGKERRESGQGKRGWREARTLVDRLIKTVDGLPTMTQILRNAEKKMDTHRGVLNVEDLTPKIIAYDWQSEPEVDPAIMRRFEEYMIETWDMLDTAMSGSQRATLDETATWFSQFASNKNSAHPYNMPISKERFMNVDWPNWKADIKRQLNVDKMTPEVLYQIPSIVKNGNEPIFVAGARSPDRLIFMTRLYSKIIGAFANWNLVNGLKGKCDIAWTPIEDIHRKSQLGMSRAQSVMYDDLKGFDTTFGKELCDAILRSFRASKFASDFIELRNAVEMMILELSLPSTLQVSPTRYTDLRPSLWSGVWGTQIIGSVVHLTMYAYGQEECGLDLVNMDVLSDDGKAESALTAEQLKRVMFGDYNDMIEGIGMKLHPDKSFIADLDDRIRVGTKNGETVEYTDSGVFLQFFMGEEYLFGNTPRRMWSFYEKERDSSQDAMADIVKKHAGALRDVRTGGDIPDSYFDLYRCASIRATMGSDTPLIDEIDNWFVNTFPSFERRFTKMFNTVDAGLWDEDVPAAGGTMESGFTVKSVVDTWQNLIAGTYEPVWDPLY